MVTVRGPKNIYQYHPRNLLIPCCLSLFLTFLGTMVGTQSMLRSGRSYSNNVSTIIRSSRHTALDELIQAQDTNAANPLPKYLEETQITFQQVSGAGS
jgi:hypothetical protein